MVSHPRLPKLKDVDKRVWKWAKERDGYTCQRCGRSRDVEGVVIHTHHIKAREEKSTRYFPDNLVSLCSGCHRYLGDSPRANDKFSYEHLGEERYYALLDRYFKVKMKDREAIDEALGWL